MNSVHYGKRKTTIARRLSCNENSEARRRMIDEKQDSLGQELLLFLVLASSRVSHIPPHQKRILAMSTDDPDTHWLWFWTQRSWMHRP